MAIIFISHRLEEIRSIADRVTIFRDGDLITTQKINEITIQFVRLGTAALAFMLITYPLRKYWIFKDDEKKTEHENNTEQHSM